MTTITKSALLSGALVLAAGAAAAQESAFIDLAGVQFRHATDQSRSSAGTITESCTYDYTIDGMVRGTSGFLALTYPTPTPLAQVLESLSPGSSAFLAGRVLNPSGTHPVVLFSEPLAGSQVISGITVTFTATFEVGIRPDDTAYFSLMDVTIDPAFLVGAAEFTSGTAAITRFDCKIDYNCDGFVDFGDYLEFLNRYDELDASADLNEDGFIDFSDYLEFLNIYDAGC